MKTGSRKHGARLGLGAAGLLAAAGIVTSIAMGMGEKPAASAATLGSSAAQAEAFKIDGVHSGTHFRVQHMGVSYVYGRFNKFEGTFLIDKDKPEASSISVTIPVDSVDSNNEGRDKHLKSPDFFSAKEFPTMTFVSKTVKKTAENTYEVAGDFTLRGQTKPLTVTIKDGGVGKGQRGGEVAGVESTFTFKRSDFGMNFMVGPIGDEVTVMVSFEGVRS